MAPMISYTLPAMQLVCNLVIPGSPGTNSSNLDSKLTSVQSENLNVSNAENSADLFYDTTPTSNPCVTESSPKGKMLPDGYVRFPELGVAFKHHRDELVEWPIAAKKCVDEGGNLAVIDSWRKFDVAHLLLSPGEFMHVGITLMYESKDWVDFRTGSILSSIPWTAGEPNGSGFCTRIGHGYRGLGRYGCTDKRYFICEIEI
ncbi:uncharacterized protein LOC124298071 [Neodiprion virginianus]|uniref:uncharacterized protein LOC124298071 n=1 Tax=Neodiprion virginianus TaxID=2961670 RepID=UPI001EE6AA6E|nr:uncharacterized protein LOC124298071 [Neodiprion virginianus]